MFWVRHLIHLTSDASNTSTTSFLCSCWTKYLTEKCYRQGLCSIIQPGLSYISKSWVVINLLNCCSWTEQWRAGSLSADGICSQGETQDGISIILFLSGCSLPIMMSQAQHNKDQRTLTPENDPQLCIYPAHGAELLNSFRYPGLVTEEVPLLKLYVQRKDPLWPFLCSCITVVASYFHQTLNCQTVGTKYG